MNKNKYYLIILLTLFCTIFNLYSAGSYRNGGPFPVPSINYTTANISSPVPFADWWTSVITKPNSDLLAAFPLYFKSEDAGGEKYGLGIYYPGTGTFVDNGLRDYVATALSPELYIRAEGWVQANILTRVDGYGNWNVRLKIDDGTAKINYTTLVKGSPTLYIETENCPKEELYFTSPILSTTTKDISDAGLSTSRPVTNDHILFQTASGNYAVFSSSGTIFRMINSQKIQITNYNQYLSVSIVLNKNDLFYFYQSAYAFVTNTSVSYHYNEFDSSMTITYNLTTVLKRAGFSSDPLICLFPHHYKNCSASLFPIEYPTIRGDLKTFQGKTFTTTHKFRGILPHLKEPFASTYNKAKLLSFISNIKNNLGFQQTDTYWGGKTLERCALLIPIADEVNETNSRNYFRDQLKAQLIDWYTDGGAVYYCYFNTWGTMIGYPTSYGTENLNDHHYHHGYFIYSSAILAMYDPVFITDYGWMVERLIRDANSPNKTDPEFAYLNGLDIYEGHCWSSGVAEFNDGNNQESTSEAINFWVGVYLWGIITGNNTYRDLGIFGYVLENTSLDEYWFDKDKTTFLPAFRAQNNMASLVWGGKYEYSLWFAGGSEAIHGIQWLPVTPASYYLNYNINYAIENYDDMVSKSPADDAMWNATIWKYRSLFDPDNALISFTNSLPTTYDTDHGLGSSDAEIYNFLYNNKSLGRIDPSYYANTSSYNVFTNNNGSSNVITYIAYNSTASSKVVNFFKDGILKYSFSVPAKQVLTSRGIQVTNWPPIPEFSIKNNNITNKTFYATNSYDLDTNTIYYAWDIDGDSVIDITWNSNKAIITNIYTTFGSNDVTLWVTDLKFTNSKTKTCYRINQRPIANLWISNVNLLNKIFYADDSYDPEGSKLYYAWDIDGDFNIDITWSTNRSIVTNIYSTYGTNFVTVWVTDLAGTNSQTRVCYRTTPYTPPPPAKLSNTNIKVGKNIENSISFPNPLHLSTGKDIKFGIYKNNKLQGYPSGTKVYLYYINGQFLWESKEAQYYDYNVINCKNSVFKNSNEVLICVIKSINKTKRFKLLILK